MCDADYEKVVGLYYQLAPKSNPFGWCSIHEQATQELKDRIHVLVKEECATRAEEWKAWREEALEGAAGEAHRFAKAWGLRKHKLPQSADGIVSCSIADLRAMQVAKCFWVKNGAKSSGSGE